MARMLSAVKPVFWQFDFGSACVSSANSFAGCDEVVTPRGWLVSAEYHPLMCDRYVDSDPADMAFFVSRPDAVLNGYVCTASSM